MLLVTMAASLGLTAAGFTWRGIEKSGEPVEPRPLYLLAEYSPMTATEVLIGGPIAKTWTVAANLMPAGSGFARVPAPTGVTGVAYTKVQTGEATGPINMLTFTGVTDIPGLTAWAVSAPSVQNLGPVSVISPRPGTVLISDAYGGAQTVIDLARREKSVAADATFIDKVRGTDAAWINVGTIVSGLSLTAFGADGEKILTDSMLTSLGVHDAASLRVVGDSFTTSGRVTTVNATVTGAGPALLKGKVLEGLSALARPYLTAPPASGPGSTQLPTKGAKATFYTLSALAVTGPGTPVYGAPELIPSVPQALPELRTAPLSVLLSPEMFSAATADGMATAQNIAGVGLTFPKVGPQVTVRFVTAAKPWAPLK